jgi:8-oxo-dGTP diphosphatase
VRAAGGVVVRPGSDERPEIVLVHRPRYDDWTLPKGKARVGETDEECALREVREETGLECELVRELPTARYRDSKGRRKTVRYWEMRPLVGDLDPRDEVDEARWVPLEAAPSALTHAREREILSSVDGG